MPAWKAAGYDTVSLERIPRVPVESIKPDRLAQWLQEKRDLLILDIRRRGPLSGGASPWGDQHPLLSPARTVSGAPPEPAGPGRGRSGTALLPGLLLPGPQGDRRCEAALRRDGTLAGLQRHGKGQAMKRHGRGISLWIFLAVALCVCILMAWPAAAATTPAAGRSCLSCHDDEVFRVSLCRVGPRQEQLHELPYRYRRSDGAHDRKGKAGVRELRQLPPGDRPGLPRRISTTSRRISAARTATGGSTPSRRWMQNFKLAVIQKCTECHANDEYVASGHSEAVLKGYQDSAACSDCHGLHDTRVYHTSLATYPDEAREFYTQKCRACHEDPKVMARSGIPVDIVKRYEATYHGKVQDIGYPTRVAGCADCHRTHNILPKTDPRSSIHPANLVANCGRCHQGFHPRFVDYKAHPNYHDRKNYPALFWTFVFMSALLIGTFLFFWIHTLLWWRKTYWEKHKREKLGFERICLPPGSEGLVPVERFSVTGADHPCAADPLLLDARHDGLSAQISRRPLGGQPHRPLGRRGRGRVLPPGRRGAAHRPVPLRPGPLHPLPLPQGAGDKGLLGAALRARLPLPEPQGPAGCHRDVPLVLRQGGDAEVRPLDLLGEVRLHGRLLGDVRHRRLRASCSGFPNGPPGSFRAGCSTWPR